MYYNLKLLEHHVSLQKLSEHFRFWTFKLGMFNPYLLLCNDLATEKFKQITLVINFFFLQSSQALGKCKTLKLKLFCTLRTFIVSIKTSARQCKEDPIQFTSQKEQWVGV